MLGPESQTWFARSVSGIPPASRRVESSIEHECLASLQAAAPSTMAAEAEAVPNTSVHEKREWRGRRRPRPAGAGATIHDSTISPVSVHDSRERRERRRPRPAGAGCCGAQLNDQRSVQYICAWNSPTAGRRRTQPAGASAAALNSMISRGKAAMDANRWATMPPAPAGTRGLSVSLCCI